MRTGALLLALALAGCGGSDGNSATKTVTHTKTTSGLKGGKAIEVESSRPRATRRRCSCPSTSPAGDRSRSSSTRGRPTLISPKLVRRLHIPVVGRSDDVTGIGGKATARSIEVREWRTGRVVLPRQKIVTLDTKGVAGPGGVLGSDVLSEFGRVLVDYKREKLVFGRAP